MVIEYSKFISNNAFKGTAVYVELVDNVTITNSTFFNNKALEINETKKDDYLSDLYKKYHDGKKIINDFYQ